MIKHAIITGGSSGIGKAIAQLLASCSVNVSIIARDRDKLEKARQEITALSVNSSPTILSFVADVAQPLEISAAIKQAIAQQGTPDLLITSAGIAIPGYFQNLSLEIFEQMMRVNYFGSLYAVKAVLPAMEAAKKGHIILISSGAGLIGIYGYTAYSSSKFALRGFAESLRGELKPKGINVSIVYPPDTDTPQLIAENKTKPPETKAITAIAKTWSAEGVAREIIKGINRQKFTITPGLEMTIINRFHSLIAPLLNKYFDRLSSRA
jgi:3-dehydrosphinganine reductase